MIKSASIIRYLIFIEETLLTDHPFLHFRSPSQMTCVQVDHTSAIDDQGINMPLSFWYTAASYVGITPTHTSQKEEQP